MKLSEAIKQLKELQDKYGNVELKVYLSYSKENKKVDEFNYDEKQRDVYIGVYG
jgi:hypothetical protein